MPSHTKVDDKFATVMEEKRVGLLNHLIGICEFPNNTYYKKCHHPTKKDRMNPGNKNSVWYADLSPLYILSLTHYF